MNFSEAPTMTSQKLSKLVTRLHAAVRVSDAGCWEWRKHTDRYGIIRVAGKSKKAHRVSWEAFNGPIPDGLNVLHKCDNTRCINPDHLFLGTQADNVADCKAKGRLVPPVCPPEKKARGDANGMRRHPDSLRGEKNGRSKLTDAQRREIATRRLAGERRIDLAAEFGVHESQIWRACKSAN